METRHAAEKEVPQSAGRVFVFNPFSEAYIRLGKAFTPVQHQRRMAEDLACLPQFLAGSGDVVLVPKPPAPSFLESLHAAGFTLPECVELANGRIPPGHPIRQRTFTDLRPWAWGPDSLQLLEPLIGQLAPDAREGRVWFDQHIAGLYSKAWSATFLRNLLDRLADVKGGPPAWLCTPHEAGVAEGTLAEALEAVTAIRRRGYHRVVVKQAHGLAGHNAIRLWEPDMLPAQRQWIARAVESGRRVVVEPWLERVADFSVQLEMEPGGLRLCGYTGLVNDLKGQFLANFAEPGYATALPGRVAACFRGETGLAAVVQRFLEEVALRMLEPELKAAGFIGPVSIDALLYRDERGACRVKPVVEINPRYTMGRLTLELMNHVAEGCCGMFRILSLAQVRAEGFADLHSYARGLAERLPLRLAGDGRIRAGAVCLNDAAAAQAVLAVLEVSPAGAGGSDDPAGEGSR